MYNKSSKIILSIIVPVYGVEDYIEDCIHSLFNQLTSEVECIFVNDGSQDQSIPILKNYLESQSELKNILIINQENQGLSMARNNVLDLAIGDYIAFLDSDDKVMENYIGEIIAILKSEKNIDLIHFNAIEQSRHNFNKELNLTEKTGLVDQVDQYYLLQ